MISTKGILFLLLIFSSVTLSFGIISKSFEIYVRKTNTNDFNGNTMELDTMIGAADDNEVEEEITYLDIIEDYLGTN